MKVIISMLIVVVMCFAMVMPGVLAADLEFSDISGHWAEDTINKWKDKGVITGYPDGTFKPNNPVTRAELAKILTLAFDLQETDMPEYDDIDTSAWYYQYLKHAAQYIPVYPLPVAYDTNKPYIDNAERAGHGFLPECNAIRVHVAQAVVQIKIKKENLSIDVPPINDVQDSLIASFKDNAYENLFPLHGQISDNVRWMFEYTWLAKELDIMHGNTAGYFVPYNEVSRAELLTIIDNMH